MASAAGGVARGRLAEERKSWRRSHPHVRALARSLHRSIDHILDRLVFKMDAWFHSLNYFFQGFVAKPATRLDGSVNLMLWNCIVPGKEGVSMHIYIYSCHHPNAFFVI
jgi:ubiquitin-conjugating enzyme E2 I